MGSVKLQAEACTKSRNTPHCKWHSFSSKGNQQGSLIYFRQIWSKIKKVVGYMVLGYHHYIPQCPQQLLKTLYLKLMMSM